jgi:hippurate hydrolase
VTQRRERQVLESLRSGIDEFVAVRRDLHRHPELAHSEHRTSATVARMLAAWGYEVQLVGGTGVVGRLVRGPGRRSLGLRADMDALPIHEGTGAAYASCHQGVMHACGHDGHTAMLLAAACYLARGGRFDGTLQVIFQPAEEGGGGALRMVEDGLFERFPCDAVFALHNMPGTPEGRLVFREGAALASSDNVTITIAGTGGHGAMPHLCADPVVVAAALVTALQTIVSRNVDPRQFAVVTVGALHAGEANNVVPAAARLELSVRAMDPAVRVLLKERIEALAEGVARSFGATATLDWDCVCPVLVNTQAETALARGVGVDLLGEEEVTLQGPSIGGSDDFAFMLQQRPGSYVFIGNGADERSRMIHHPEYDFNDGILAVGGAFWVCLAERFLAAS